MSDHDPKRATAFLGTGWSFPPQFDASGGVVMRSDEQDIADSLQALFRTTPGERFLNPKFGVDVLSLLFEPISATLSTLKLDEIRMALLLFEPRIEVDSLTLDTSRQPEGLIELALDYRVRATDTRYSLVVPYAELGANLVSSALFGERGRR